MTLIDYDNDGWLDLCVVGSDRAASKTGSVRLWRNGGGGSWLDVTARTGLAHVRIPPVRDVVAADVDGDGDSDLLLLTAKQRLRLLRNEGGHVNGQLKIRLVGLKTNPKGIGTHIELRKGEFWVTRSVSNIPIEIGLGGRKQLDTIQTIWTNGVVDNQLDVQAMASPITITEKNVATGSCPFLYAWDGETYRFVTDILGNAPLGLPLSRDLLVTADPDEFVMIGDGDAFPTREGAYALKITSEFVEVLYLDYVKLVAVDHSREVEIHSTDKVMPPPYPASELWPLRNPIRLVQAEGDDGIDRTRDLARLDGAFAPPGSLLPPPLRGMCHPLSIVLDFGRLRPDRPLVLALTGWLQYGQASTNIAISQNSSLKIIPPMLEVETAGGDWLPLDLRVGMPAGKTKTILCDLDGKLPKDAKRLRLTTTFEIHWDRIGLFEREYVDQSQVHELEISQADLAWRGFCDIRSRGPGHPTTPDYNNLSEQPPWRNVLEGWCTRYGDVRDLIAGIDGKLVVCNAGDAITLQFDVGDLPPVSDDLVRTFFFYCVGWEKDGDHNVVGGDAVEPLPVHNAPVGKMADVKSIEWVLQYNTRWVPRDRFRLAPSGQLPEQNWPELR